MSEHPPGALHLAARVLRHETGGTTGSSGTARALESTWRKLSERLEPLIGREGADALIARAVHLARRQYPFLEGVRAAAGAGADFAAIRGSLMSQADEQAEAASVAVLERLLGLLAGLLGEELGLWPVRAVWPDAVLGAPEPRLNEREA